MPIRPSKRPSETTKTRAKQLRANATVPEVKLWEVLRGRKVGGLKFRRQHPIEPYIADFYCAEAELVIELDGRSHDDQIDYDQQRTLRMKELGLYVLRFSNDEVLANIEGVCETIHSASIKNMSSTKQPR